MVEGLIGKKIGMTQIFDEKGNVAPVTIIKVGPCTVIQKKTREKDGYSAIQMGFLEEKSIKKPTKPVMGHFSKSGIPPVRILREFRFAEKAKIKEGDQFFVDIFQEGERVRIIGDSKGKGFAGVIKRWGFHGGKKTHGSTFHRSPGSIGASAYPSRVVKGKKMPGQMGNKRVTIKNLTVIQADKENNLLVVRGAVPGARGGYLLIKKTSYHPESYQPKPSEAEVPRPEEVKAEKPGAEKPKSEEVKPKESKAEKSEAIEPKPEEVKAEKPGAEKPKSEEIKPKESKAEKSEAIEPEPEEAKAEKLGAEKPEPSKKEKIE
jgi:large subunit ribosomal protein L3